MRSLKILALPAVASLCLFVATPPPTHAQVSVSVGVAPACPYGYYEAPPYSCAPYGYYGPEWFSSGVFIGAGPWFHGPSNFHGNVNNRFDPRHGYKGKAPEHGPAQAPRASFKANESRDGQGHADKPHK